MCVIEVKEGGREWGGVPGCGQGGGEMAKLTVHLFEKCEEENFQNNGEQILSSLQARRPSDTFLYYLLEETMSGIIPNVKKRLGVEQQNTYIKKFKYKFKIFTNVDFTLFTTLSWSCKPQKEM